MVGKEGPSALGNPVVTAFFRGSHPGTVTTPASPWPKRALLGGPCLPSSNIQNATVPLQSTPMARSLLLEPPFFLCALPIQLKLPTDAQ